LCSSNSSKIPLKSPDHDDDTVYTEGRIFSWGKSSRGRLGRETSSNDNDGCPSPVTVNAAAADDDDNDNDDDDNDDDDDDATSRHIQVTSLCCSHSISLLCLTQRNLALCSIFVVWLLTISSYLF